MIDRLDIHAFADRELPAEDMARKEQEIAASPDASRELEAIQNLKGCLQTKMTPPAFGDLWSECRSRLDELDRVKKTEFIVAKYAWALSGLLFFVILGGGLFNHFHGSSVSVGRLASDISGMTPVTASSQPQQLSDFINDPRLHIPTGIVSLAYVDTPEGRIKSCTIQDQEGVFDVVRIPNVANVEGVQPIGDDMFAGQLNGRNCVIRLDSGCAIVVVGNRETSELRDITESLLSLRHR